MSSERNERPGVQTAPPLCANNCGFYGSPANRNLCSKCYREFLKAEALQEAEALRHSTLPADSTAATEQTVSLPSIPAPSRAEPDSSRAADAEACARQDALRESPSSQNGDAAATTLAQTPDSAEAKEAVVLDDTDEQQQPPQEEAGVEKKAAKGSRCRQCNRKVGLLGFQCRCGDFFCGEHRYADAHCCEFDYKTFEREQLKKQNNKVVADKLQKL